MTLLQNQVELKAAPSGTGCGTSSIEMNWVTCVQKWSLCRSKGIWSLGRGTKMQANWLGTNQTVPWGSSSEQRIIPFLHQGTILKHNSVQTGLWKNVIYVLHENNQLIIQPRSLFKFSLVLFLAMSNHFDYFSANLIRAMVFPFTGFFNKFCIYISMYLYIDI